MQYNNLCLAIKSVAHLGKISWSYLYFDLSAQFKISGIKSARTPIILKEIALVITWRIDNVLPPTIPPPLLLCRSWNLNLFLHISKLFPLIFNSYFILLSSQVIFKFYYFSGGGVEKREKGRDKGEKWLDMLRKGHFGEKEKGGGRRRKGTL